MTLIIGIEDAANNRSIVATDSGAWKGDQADVVRTPKIWRSNGWIAGLSGTMAQSQRLRALSFPEMHGDEPREEAERWLLAWSLDALESVAKVNELVRRADDNEHPHSPALIVAWRYWCWYVLDGEATNVARGWNCCGVAEYATGALSALHQRGFGGPLSGTYDFPSGPHVSEHWHSLETSQWTERDGKIWCPEHGEVADETT